MQREYKEITPLSLDARGSAKVERQKKASASPTTGHVPFMPSTAMTTNSTPTMLHGSNVRPLAEGKIPSANSKSQAVGQSAHAQLDRNSSMIVEQIAGGTSTGRGKVPKSEKHFSSEGITTSDDDFSVASDLLSRLSRSAISLQDQLCSAAFMGNGDAVAALLMNKIQVNACGMVSFWDHVIFLRGSGSTYFYCLFPHSPPLMSSSNLLLNHHNEPPYPPKNAILFTPNKCLRN